MTIERAATALHEEVAARRAQLGLTLVELLVTTALAVFVVAGLNGVVRTSLQTKAALEERLALVRQAEFAMERMAWSIAHARRLLLPLADNPATNWPERIREQTVPPSPPTGSSSLATAVLAVTLPAQVDLDFNGVPDADDDGDGRIDEDLPSDNHQDSATGLWLLDDDGDGQVDESGGDDEAGGSNEDPIDGIDNDGDGSVDEDAENDANADDCPGSCGVDDDRDGQIDESASEDDDEDGRNDEDPYDPLAFYLVNGGLVERMPVPWDEDKSNSVDGRDFVVSELARRVSRLRFERATAAPSGLVLVDITLELSSAAGQTVSVTRRVRVGGAL